MKNMIYLDHAATTPVTEAVLAEMLPYFREYSGNASSVYTAGREARKAVEKARRQVARNIGADANEILFTSGGSESDNFAIKCAAFALRKKGMHIITSAVEHPAVLNTCRWLETQGFKVSYVASDCDGRIHPEYVLDAIRPETILISVMAANNEVGTIEPVKDIGRIAREHGIVFHTDAVQAVGAMPVDVNNWYADMLSLSAHKFGGPKGIGALFVRKGTRVDPLIHGGKQERGLRAGTENVPAIVGLGKAIEDASANLQSYIVKTTALRDRLTNGILRTIEGAHLNGPEKNRLPNNSSIRFDGIDGEALLLRLDLEGIAASAGSACTAGSQQVSHVLRTMGLSEAQAKSSLRLTVGGENSEEEIDETIRIIKEIVEDLRKMFHHL